MHRTHAWHVHRIHACMHACMHAGRGIHPKLDDKKLDVVAEKAALLKIVTACRELTRKSVSKGKLKNGLAFKNKEGKIERVPVPLNCFNYQVALIELGLTSVKNPGEKGQAAKAVFSMVKGGIKAALGQGDGLKDVRMRACIHKSVCTFVRACLRACLRASKRACERASE